LKGIVVSNIHSAFASGKAFIGFVTGGDPTIEASEKIILAMAAAGADLIEVGVPFSDPIAEGAVIRHANLRALAAGATVEKVFALVARLRKKTAMPLVFLTYLNPVLRYGYDRFFACSEQIGLDGVIIPDLPFEEHGEVKPFAAAHNVDLISMVAPTSSKQRIHAIAAVATGFLYVVSSLGVTGVRSEITTDLGAIVRAAREVSAIPAAVGFGINTLKQAREISRVADGVIVGSAIVKIVAQYGENSVPFVADYVRQMKAAVREN
jgi:tryptophan synthase alpha chain